uniref:Uncharacterized protein n=1 Tax=Meloidogyne incognita TaxID=6306 RepID=A0A914KR72_MELIC
MPKMEIFLNYLFILFAITLTLANKQNIKETESTTENVSVVPAGVKTRKIYKLGRDPKELKAEVDPLSTEVRWKRVNLSDVSNDTLNTDGFINVACYTELKAAPEKLYNKAFRFDVQKIFEKSNKHCTFIHVKQTLVYMANARIRRYNPETMTLTYFRMYAPFSCRHVPSISLQVFRSKHICILGSGELSQLYSRNYQANFKYRNV